MTPSSILCHFRKWLITSLPWNWVREQRSKEAFVSVERAVSAGSRGLVNWAQERWVWGHTSGHKMLSLKACVDEEAWSKEVTAGSGGRWRVGAGAKVKQGASRLWASPSQREKGVHLYLSSRSLSSSKLLKFRADRLLSHPNIQSLVWGQWHLKSYLNRKSTALKVIAKRVQGKKSMPVVSVLQSQSTINST